MLPRALRCGVVMAFVAGCTTVIEERGYDTLALGDSKPMVLSKLREREAVASVQPALTRPDDSTPHGGEDEPPIVRLAATTMGNVDQSTAESEYLLQYDLWYFEETGGDRSVLLTFAGGALTKIEGRRRGEWWEILF